MGSRGVLGRLAVLALILVTVASCQPQEVDKSLSRVIEAGELTIGIDPSYPPFETIDGKGQIAGYDVDLAEEIARRLGVRVSFVSVDIGSIQDGLLAKKFDVIVSSLPPFPEFTKKISYSRPYFNAGQVLVVASATKDISSLKDLEGKTLGVEGGSEADMAMRNLPRKPANFDVQSYSTAEAAMTAVKAGRIEAAAIDTITATEFSKREGGVSIVGEPLTVEPFVIAARKADGLLLARIDRILAEIETDGFDAKLRAKWLGMSGS